MATLLLSFLPQNLLLSFLSSGEHKNTQTHDEPFPSKSSKISSQAVFHSTCCPYLTNPSREKAMTSESEAAVETPPASSSSSSPGGGGNKEEKGKGKAKDETIPTNYRVYCVSRAHFIAEGFQIQRFLFPTRLPARFFDLDIHCPVPGTNDITEEAKARSYEFRDENNEIMQKLVYDHTQGIFGTREWPCTVCGGAAVKLLHGLIPHFEVKGENSGDDDDHARGYYGASISVPLTEGRIYRIGVNNGDKAKMKEARRWINRLALAPISNEPEETLQRLKPCIIDVATPVCGMHLDCEDLANEFRRDLATGILAGVFKVDPEDMPWWAADEGLVPDAELKGASNSKVVQCVVCGEVDEDGIMKCGRCELVGYVFVSRILGDGWLTSTVYRYCSRACQKDHWAIHKYHCDELRDRAHAAILVEMSRSGIENDTPKSAVDSRSTGAVVRSSEEKGQNIPQATVAQDTKAKEDKGAEEVADKPKKKKNKGRNRGKRKGKGQAKQAEVEAEESKTKADMADMAGEAESSGTEAGDVVVVDDVKQGQGKENVVEEAAKEPTAADEGENTWMPLL